MPFDANQPFALLDEDEKPASGPPPFDPGKPWAAVPDHDPNQDLFWVDTNQGPERAYKAATGETVVLPSHGSRIYKSTTGENVELPPVSQPPPDEITDPFASTAQAFSRGGRFARAALADVGSGEAQNIRASLNEQPLPVDVQLQHLNSPALSTAYKVAGGAVEMAPKLAAVSLSGPAAPAVAGTLFGFDDQGTFHPGQAALAVVLPEVSKMAGGLSAKVANKLGVESTTALNLVNAGGRYASAQAVLAAQTLPGYSQMTPEQKQDAVASIMVNGLLGLADFSGYKTADGRVDLPKAVQAFQEHAETAASGEQPFEYPTGAQLRMPQGGEPVRAEAEPFEKGPPPLKREPIEVPATPAEPERGLSAVDEIRRANATTKNQVKKLFPQRGLSNEEAARLLDDAYPERIEQRKQARKDEYARSQQTTAEVHGDVQPQPGEGEGQVPAEESGGGIQPPAEGPQGEVSLSEPLKRAQAIFDAPPEQKIEYKGGLTREALEQGAQLKTKAELDKLVQLRDQFMQRAREARANMKPGDMKGLEAAVALGQRSQFFNEMLEGATGGNNDETKLKTIQSVIPDYKPPFLGLDLREKAQDQPSPVKGTAPAPVETVKEPALKLEDGTVLTGASHLSILKGLSDDMVEGSLDGFVTTTGRFVDRDEAAKLQGKESVVKKGGLHSGDISGEAEPEKVTNKGPETVAKPTSSEPTPETWTVAEGRKQQSRPVDYESEVDADRLKEAGVVRELKEQAEDGGDIITYQGKPAGWVHVDDNGVLTAIEVNPEFRRKGIARQVLKDLSDAQGGGPVKVFLPTEEGRKLFEGVGKLTVNEDGEGKVELFGENIPKVVTRPGAVPPEPEGYRQPAAIESPAADKVADTFTLENVSVPNIEDATAPGPTTTKKLKVQKQFLQTAIDAAYKKAPLQKSLPADQRKAMEQVKEAAAALQRAVGKEKGAKLKTAMMMVRRIVPHVVIEVPGDGTFTIVNTKDALDDFRKTVEKRFPKSAAKVSTGPSQPRTESPSIKPGKGTTEDALKAAEPFVSEDATREPIRHIYGNGQELVATDGRHLIRIRVKGFGTPEKSVKVNPTTGKTEPWSKDEKYPRYEQVIPREDTHRAVASVPVEDFIRAVRAAEIMTTEKSNSIRLWRNPDGSIGTSAGSDDGQVRHNVSQASEIIGNYNPAYLLDVAQAASRMGDTKIDLYAAKEKPELNPLMVRGKDVQGVVMPMRLEGGEGGTTVNVNAASNKTRVAHREPMPDLGETKGGVRGFGSAIRGSTAPAAPTPPQVAQTPQQLTQLQASRTPGLASTVSQGIKSLLLPSSKSAAHLTEAERLGSKLGAMHHRQEASATQLRPASRFFDRKGVHREDLTPQNNAGIQFMSAMSQGRALPPREQAIADQIEKEFKKRLVALDNAGAPLQTIRQNYFPGMWTADSRRAFNQAMDEAEQAGRIPANFDVNTATPQLRASIKARVDELLKAGQGSDKDMLPYLTRRPLKGQESFRKQKVFSDIMDAAEFGLKPVSANPVDLVQWKLAEMDRSIMANEEFQSLKDAGKLKIISPYEQTPEGWVRVNDKYGTIYGPPTTTLTEHVDKAVYEGLVDFARSLGIRHIRSAKFPSGPGSRALGLSYTGQNLIRSKHATELSVIAHEIGHQLDDRYGLWNEIVNKAVGFGKKGVPTKGASQTQRATVQKELRAIADLTGQRGGDPRSKPEKIAQMVEAYVHAPEAMEKAAPNVFAAFRDFVNAKPELQELAKIKPGIELTKLQSEKYVGLPIIGYRVVPKETADILNNYLSSSLYNNQYFGPLYKAWMSTANALNQTQLGVGSAFHAGFTTIDAQISAGADLVKDAYGVVRGNRSVKDLAKSAERWSVASARTALTGDKVLNAWRNPDGVIEPRVRDIVRAAELAGGGFKLETGVHTEQLTKLMRDWFSGHRARAAVRSPVALTELMAKPIMDWLVPRQKAGVFAEMAGRIIDQHPGVPLEELTPQFRQAWNRVDARLGQVRYDRLFANNTAKNIVQGLVRAPGWSGGTIAEIGGAFPDAASYMKEFVKTGKPPADMPDRVAYTVSLLATVMAANGLLTYALSGRKPQGMDYLAFTDGSKDERGNTKRWLLPSYMKDLIAFAVHPGTTVLNKSHPLISVINDVLQNKDYYGYEVRDPSAPLWKQVGQTGKYVLKSFEPFWIRGAVQTHQQGAGPAAQAAAYVGVMPAPGYVTMTPIQRRISDLYHKRTGEGVKPYEKQFAPKKPRDLVTADISMFKRLPLSDQKALWANMTPEERNRYR